MAYAWKSTARVSIPASIAGPEIERIRREQEGFFTPAAVVRAAQPKSSPLHPAFEWDDLKAAAAHREDQAKYLIRHIVVLNAGDPDRDPIRAFVSVEDKTASDSEDDGPRYTSISHAMSEPHLREHLLSTALRDMRSFEQRYSQFAELAGVVRAITKARPKVEAAIAAAAMN